MTQKTFTEYQSMAAYTAIYPGQNQTFNFQGEDTDVQVPLGLLYVALGLGEVGEVQGKIKKILRDHGGEITYDVKQAIAKELGDVLWYVAMVSTELGLFMEDIATDNITKLLDRKSRGVLQGSGDDR